MTAPPAVRRLLLTVHVSTSLGWLGALIAYLALDITAAVSHDVELVRGFYLAMDALVDFVIVPLALASVVIGVVNALSTPWGLVRHYWVVMKLVLTAITLVVLLLEVPTVEALATAAAMVEDPRRLPGTLLHSAGGLLVLLVVTVLSTYKPRGLTRYGWRRRAQRPGRTQAAA